MHMDLRMRLVCDARSKLAAFCGQMCLHLKGTRLWLDRLIGVHALCMMGSDTFVCVLSPHFARSALAWNFSCTFVTIHSKSFWGILSLQGQSAGCNMRPILLLRLYSQAPRMCSSPAPTGQELKWQGEGTSVQPK